MTGSHREGRRVGADGAIRWRNETGRFHRTDGPAVEYENGDKRWYVDGLLHRIDGPAFENANGIEHWYVNGEYLTQRDDGRIVEVDGFKYKLVLRR